MNHDELAFQEFLAGRMRDKGLSVKRLSEATGIAPSHLENMLHGNFDDLPSTPYFRGYVLRIAKALDFDGHEWWDRLRGEEFVKISGPQDALPQNRFVKRAPSIMAWGIVGVVILIIIAFVIALPRITGQPSIAVSSPSSTPFNATSTTFTLRGTVRNADSLFLNGDTIPIAADGTWEKGVLLQNGVNTFEISAKKLLGGEAKATEQIIYEPAGGQDTTGQGASSAPPQNFPTIHPQEPTPATGTFFD